MNTSTLIVLFLTFYIVAELMVLSMKKDMNVHLIIATAGFLFVIMMALLDKIINPEETQDTYKEPENQDFVPSLRSVCKGGRYMWQGDTPLDRACRAMYDDPELEKTIRNPGPSYMMGSPPYAGFVFDPVIDDNFEFVRCSNKNQTA